MPMQSPGRSARGFTNCMSPLNHQPPTSSPATNSAGHPFDHAPRDVVPLLAWLAAEAGLPHLEEIAARCAMFLEVAEPGWAEFGELDQISVWVAYRCDS